MNLITAPRSLEMFFGLKSILAVRINMPPLFLLVLFSILFPIFSSNDDETFPDF